jgi:acyl carrier protein
MNGTTTEPSRTDVAERLRGILRELLSLDEPPALSEASVLMKELEIDSVGMVDLVDAIEETFAITLPDDIDLKQIRTFGDVIDRILEQIAKR